MQYITINESELKKLNLSELLKKVQSKEKEIKTFFTYHESRLEKEMLDKLSKFKKTAIRNIKVGEDEIQ